MLDILLTERSREKSTEVSRLENEHFPACTKKFRIISEQKR